LILVFKTASFLQFVIFVIYSSSDYNRHS